MCEVDGEDLEVNSEGPELVITTKKVYYHEPAGYISHVRLILTSRGRYCIQVNVKFTCVVHPSHFVPTPWTVGSPKCGRRRRNIN